ncbi:MAG: hypothetical protein QME66_05985 [Candidatus Eisenbacteria bacterium]|nr:hypothetical protein [Candidatus Eisenbacteria bacterium]
MKKSIMSFLVAFAMANPWAFAGVVPGTVNGARITPNRVNATVVVVGAPGDAPDASSVFTSSGSVVIQSTTTTATHELLDVENTANASIVSFQVNGAALFNQQSGVGNFQVQSDNMANAILVDGTNDFVGINDASPDAMVDVIARTASSSGVVITAAGSQTADLLSLRDSSEARLISVDASGNAVFTGYVVDRSSFQVTGNEASSGRMVQLQPTTGANGALIHFRNTTGDFYIGSDDSTGGDLTGVAYANAIWSVSNTSTVLGTNNTERMRIRNTGEIVFGVSASTVIYNGASGLEWHDPDVAGNVGGISSGSNDLTIAAANNRNVRVDNDTRNVLFVSDTNGFLGINDTSPDSMEDIVMLNASSSGTVITAAATPTADLLSIRDSNEAPLFFINAIGHAVSSGTTPALTNCGTSPSIIGSDNSGKITVGSSAADTCTATFGTAYTNAPACVFSGQDANDILGSTTTASGFAFVTPGAQDISSEVISYICMGVDR